MIDWTHAFTYLASALSLGPPILAETLWLWFLPF